MSCAAIGALPILYAATYPGLPSGSYIGSSSRNHFRGHPTVLQAPPAAYDQELAWRLWQASEELTGVALPL
jgi:hypothetical protein